MSEEYEYPEFIVKLGLDFKAIRIVDNRMIPTHWNIQAEVLYEDDGVEEDPDGDLEIKIAIAKIKYWLEHTLGGSLIIDIGNEWAFESFFDEDGKCTTGNNIVMAPTTPTDDLIAELLHSKMNAFGGKHIQFGVMELTSDDKSNLSYMFTGDGENNLPEMTDWIGERTYFDKPWWARDDASTIDLIPGDEANLDEKPSFAYSLDFIRQSFKKQLGEEAVVIRPNFKPTVINGGLDGV
ncbi:hypothetical protein D3C87_737040 [compost metagenome]